VIKTLAHLSDLHLGRAPEALAGLRRAVATLVEAQVDHVVVTGDITDHGRLDELATFRRVMAPLAERLTLVPGNHDRLGEDAGRLLQHGRVEVDSRPGLHLIRLDSTAPHNKRLVDCHGMLTEEDVDAVVDAACAAPAGALVGVLLHHHVHPLPGDDVWERLAGMVRLPWTLELRRGRMLIERLMGRCDLVLHGHRHVASELIVGRDGARPLRVVNAGTSTGLGRARLFCHSAGTITGEGWLEFGRTARPRIEPGFDGAAAAA
jgi:3',5'-cyclic-AMP phosphodiesterase